MTDLTWEEPPRRHKKSEWFETLMAMKSRPGHHARLGTFGDSGEASRLATSVRAAATHLQPANPDGEWEVFARSIPAGGAGVWARWMPADVPPPQPALLDDPQPDAESQPSLVDDAPARVGSLGPYEPF